VRSRLLVAALIASAAVVSGCLEQETVLMVRPDGTGTLTERTLLSAQTVQMMKGMAATMGGQDGQAAPGPLDQMIDKGTLAKRAVELGEGVTLSSAKKLETEDGRAGSEVVYEVKDVSKLNLGLQQQMGGVSGMGGMGKVRVRRTPDSDQQQEKVKLAFVKSAGGGPAKLTITMPEPKKKPEKDPDAASSAPGMPDEMKAQMQAQAKMMMKQMFGGMRIRLVIRTAGRISKTNATYPSKDGRGVTLYDMNLGKLIQDDEAFSKMEAMDKNAGLAEAKKALNDPLLKKYMQVELKPKVEIEFK